MRRRVESSKLKVKRVEAGARKIWVGQAPYPGVLGKYLKGKEMRVWEWKSM
jgi:hypothetical protein